MCPPSRGVALSRVTPRSPRSVHSVAHSHGDARVGPPRRTTTLVARSFVMILPPGSVVRYSYQPGPDEIQKKLGKNLAVREIVTPNTAIRARLLTVRINGRETA